MNDGDHSYHPLVMIIHLSATPNPLVGNWTNVILTNVFRTNVYLDKGLLEQMSALDKCLLAQISTRTNINFENKPSNIGANGYLCF